MGAVYRQTERSVPAHPHGSLGSQETPCRHSQQSHVSPGKLPVQREIQPEGSSRPARSEKCHLSAARSTSL